MQTILLTSGRGSFALLLARSFHAAGHRVLVAECWPRTACRYSRSVHRYFHVPSPARATQEWLEAILEIVHAFGVDVIVPIYEEALYLARGVESLPAPPKVFTADFRTLLSLHNKWTFNQTAREIGLSVPETQLLVSRDEALAAFSGVFGSDSVFKAVYSRWAMSTILRPQTLHALESVEPSASRPWVAQKYLPGRPIATFSLAHNGRLTGHTAYACGLSVGCGPTLASRPLDQPAAFEWVRTFVDATKYTGQIGIDFIEDDAGNVSAIECNPRITGGVFALKDDPDFVRAYLDPETPRVGPTPDRAVYTSRLAMLLVLLRRSEAFPGMREWTRIMLRGRAANEFHFRDPLPSLVSPCLTFAFLDRCRRENADGRALLSADNEWSGEPEAASESPNAAGLLASRHSESETAQVPVGEGE